MTCCGYANSGSIGHGFPTAVKGAIPLYRLFWGKLGLHLSSTSNSEGAAIG